VNRINLLCSVYAGQLVGIRKVADQIWLLGFFIGFGSNNLNDKVFGRTMGLFNPAPFF
jgi:hypothetical protein